MSARESPNPMIPARVTVHADDCLRVLATLPDASVDAVVTDPPYGLSATSPAKVADALIRWGSGDRTYVPDGVGFMDQAWDRFVPPPAVWDECYRVLKPGGHLLAFAGSRTHDLMGLSIRLAQFEIRDSLAWLYGTGFPKSADVAKLMDKGTGQNRERQLEFTAWMRSTGITPSAINRATGTNMGGHYLTDASQPAIATAELFDLLRPLLPEVPESVERLVAERTGIAWTDYVKRPKVGTVRGKDTSKVRLGFTGKTYGGGEHYREHDVTESHSADAKRWEGWGTALKPAFEPITMARKPLEGTVAANVRAYGTGALNVGANRLGGEARVNPAAGNRPGGSVYAMGVSGMPQDAPAREAEGRFPANVLLDESAADAVGKGAQFFYTAKAPTSERPMVGGVAHPTVKPLAIMRWLLRLVVQPGGLVLDPFAGSGTTLEAALLEGFTAVGIEANVDYLPLIETRLARALDIS